MTRELTSRSDVVVGLVGRLGDEGRSRSVVLRGPAGIGKTHVARSAADSLEARGVPVRRASGGAAQRRLAFGALLHLLPASAEPVSVEFELIQRLRSALVAQGDTAVVVIDDIALLDERSAGLIESVLLQGDIVVLATERTPLAGAPAEHALSAAMRSNADVVDVPPMTESELTDLLVEWAGPGEIGSMRRLGEMARGNPLVLRELLVSAQAVDAIGERDGLWFLGDFRFSGYSLERLVTEHLERLDEHQWELLRCLAVAGSLPRRLAARIDGESLEHLERGDLVRGDPTTIGHPLYAEVIAETLSAEHVRRVCSKLVATIGPDDEVDAARLGSWLLRAERGIDDDVARRGVALALARWENDLALRLIDAIDAPTVADRVQLVWARANVGRSDLAALAAEDAVAAARTDAERVMAGVARAELWALQMGRRDDALEALTTLRSTLEDRALIARVDAATALYSHVTGHRVLARTAAEAAAAEGDVDDSGVRLAVAVGDAFDKVFSGAFHEAGPVIDGGRALAEERGEQHNWVRLEIVDAMRLMFLGDLAASSAIVEQALRLADISGVRPAHVVWLGLAAQLAQIDGDYVQAERRTREAIRAGDHVDDFGAVGFVRGDLSALLIEMGRGSDFADGSSPIGLARARIRVADLDDVDRLGAELAEMTADAGYGLWAPWVAREAIRRRPAPRCTALLEDWAREFDGPIVAHMAAHAAGLLGGDPDRVASAARDLERCAFVTPSLDAHLAAVELRLDSDGASARSRRDLLHVRAMSARITPTLPPAVEDRIVRASVIAGMPSDRQLEIADLAASGLASKEIANRLVVSARTVDNHLAAVYRKLDVAGRDELRAVLDP